MLFPLSGAFHDLFLCAGLDNDLSDLTAMFRNNCFTDFTGRPLFIVYNGMQSFCGSLDFIYIW